jgi:hypothetical protein
MALGGLARMAQYTKTDIIVAVVCVVPVARGKTHPVGIVVPRAAANHTAHALPFSRLNTVVSKMLCRNWWEEENPPQSPFCKGGSRTTSTHIKQIPLAPLLCKKGEAPRSSG